MAAPVGRWQPGAGHRYIPAHMERLLLYHDFSSPFCRLAAQLAVRAADRTGLRLRPVPFELRPAPAALPASDDPGLAEELETARELAGRWELELGRLAAVPRTRKAHEAVAYAEAEDGDVPALLDRLYRDLWEEGRDIGRLDVLADAGEAAGLDREAVHVALGVDRFQEAVVREQEAAAAAGLDGVPAFQVRNVVASGLFPLDELLEWIEENRIDALHSNDPFVLDWLMNGDGAPEDRPGLILRYGGELPFPCARIQQHTATIGEEVMLTLLPARAHPQQHQDEEQAQRPPVADDDIDILYINQGRENDEQDGDEQYAQRFFKGEYFLDPGHFHIAQHHTHNYHRKQPRLVSEYI